VTKLDAHGGSVKLTAAAAANAATIQVTDGTHFPFDNHETSRRVDPGCGHRLHRRPRRLVDRCAAIAYPPTRQGQRGTFAIVIQGDVQHGLWQR
jgi:hypothetical protein